MSWLEEVFVFIAAGFISALVCITGYHVPAADAFIGCSVLVAITLVGIALAKIVPGKLPMVFWVSIVAIVAALPSSPVAPFVTASVGKVDFLALCTVVLSYAGLSIGKDFGMFKQMSWRIIIVALAVYTGTFLFATAIAQIMLHLEGII